MVPQDRKDFKSDRYNNNRPRRDFTGHSGSTTIKVVSTVFQEPVHQILKKIKNEPYFHKMEGDPTKHNKNLHYQYHQERGHTTEDCMTLWSHLEQLVKIGKLKQFLYQHNGQGNQARSRAQRDASVRPPLGTINVIFAALRRTGSRPSRMLSIAQPFIEDIPTDSKRSRMEVQLALSFSDEYKVGTLQPHNDALVVILRIKGYDMKRVLVDQGSGAEIMYLDLFKGLKLRLKDLTYYNSPLIGFNGNIVFPKGQIRLPVQTRLEVVEVNFIVVDAFSL